MRLGARTRDTYLSAQFWRLARRIGKKKAAVAVAHSIPVICRHLLTDDCDYDDLGGDYFTRRNTDRRRDRLIHRLHGLGYRVTWRKSRRPVGCCRFTSQRHQPARRRPALPERPQRLTVQPLRPWPRSTRVTRNPLRG